MTQIRWTQRTRYSRHLERATNYEECLLQLFYGATWDGDLIGKQTRDDAVEKGHAIKYEGWNLITPEGVKVLIESGAIKP